MFEIVPNIPFFVFLCGHIITIMCARPINKLYLLLILRYTLSSFNMFKFKKNNEIDLILPLVNLGLVIHSGLFHEVKYIWTASLFCLYLKSQIAKFYDLDPFIILLILVFHVFTMIINIVVIVNI